MWEDGTCYHGDLLHDQLDFAVLSVFTCMPYSWSATDNLQKGKKINFIQKHSLHSHSMNTDRRIRKFITTPSKRKTKKHTLPHRYFETATGKWSTNFTQY